MACGRDEGCLRIANSIYPGLQSDIDSSINSIKNSIDGIISDLSGLSIPDDYLGSKVKSRVTAICSNLSDDSSAVVSLGGNIDGFISEKIAEHEKHYRDWKIEQQRKIQLRRQAEKEQGINKFNRSKEERE